MAITDPAVLRAIDEEANAALFKGALYSAMLSFPIAGVVAALHLTGAVKGLALPFAFSSAGAVMCIVGALLSRRKFLSSWVRYPYFIFLVSFPTLFFIISEAVLPFGTATFLNGPMSFVYFMLLLVTGFLFDWRLSLICGVIAAAGHMGSYFLARPNLMSLDLPDPGFKLALAGAHIYAFKSAMIFFAGMLAAVLSGISRRLVVRVLEEEREKQGISRLFGEFVSPEVREKVVAEKASVIGEKKKVVVLFSDIRSFSTHSEGEDPERLVKGLNLYFDRMVRCITENGGVVDKFIGDAIMAVFGGVLDLDNPCHHALVAARAMRAAMSDYQADARARDLPAFENGIGMHFGEALQGTLGSPERKEFTVIGDAVNTASRIEGLTKTYPFPILVTREFQQALPEADRALCRPVGETKVKGKTRVITLYGVPDEEEEE